MVFAIGPEQKAFRVVKEDVEVINSPCDMLHAIELGGGGKVSCNILRSVIRLCEGPAPVDKYSISFDRRTVFWQVIYYLLRFQPITVHGRFQ